MRISEVARRADIRPSAIRYYESIGVLPPAQRVNGSRRYGPDILDRLAIIRFGLRVGFTLRELRLLFEGFASRSARKKLAQGKLRELKTLNSHVQLMQRMLSQIRLCRCGTIRDCAQRLLKLAESQVDGRARGLAVHVQRSSVVKDDGD